MFTQCSKCETVFRLSAEVLRAAGGQVRCGRCGEVFNALARLAEQAGSFNAGESPLDLEVRADSILESVGVPRVAQTVAKDFEDFAPPGVEIAHLQVLDWTEDDVMRPPSENEDADPDPSPPSDPSLEFTLPPGELDRIFVESKAVAPQAPPRSEPVPEPPVLDRRARFEIPGVPDDVRREMLAGLEQRLDPLGPPGAERTGRRRRGQFALWLVAAVIAALLLAAQVGYSHREWFGTPAAAPAILAAYQLRQWGVTGDPDANGTLRVRASILNTAAQLQPYPLLRVTLADRFGKRIGMRDFEPSEYVGKPTARLLAPGEQADATLQILDPGKNAEGFEIDVCMRGADRRVACASDMAPQGGK